MGAGALYRVRFFVRCPWHLTVRDMFYCLEPAGMAALCPAADHGAGDTTVQLPALCGHPAAKT